MGDEYAGEVKLIVQMAQPAAKLLTNFCIKCPEGLIQQQYFRLNRQRAC